MQGSFDIGTALAPRNEISCTDDCCPGVILTAGLLVLSILYTSAALELSAARDNVFFSKNRCSKTQLSEQSYRIHQDNSLSFLSNNGKYCSSGTV